MAADHSSSFLQNTERVWPGAGVPHVIVRGLCGSGRAPYKRAPQDIESIPVNSRPRMQPCCTEIFELLLGYSFGPPPRPCLRVVEARRIAQQRPDGSKTRASACGAQIDIQTAAKIEGMFARRDISHAGGADWSRWLPRGICSEGGLYKISHHDRLPTSKGFQFPVVRKHFVKWIFANSLSHIGLV